MNITEHPVNTGEHRWRPVLVVATPFLELNITQEKKSMLKTPSFCAAGTNETAVRKRFELHLGNERQCFPF